MDPLVEQKVREIKALAAKGMPPEFARGKAPRPRFIQEMEEQNARMAEFMRLDEWEDMLEKEREEKRIKEIAERRARRQAQKNANK